MIQEDLGVNFFFTVFYKTQRPKLIATYEDNGRNER